ncbi:transaldolase family protein [Merismopedia glauca]|uniref:Transaldolase n=1 Tax=Merismopedia glauca CCAP 1448/3 TaxID=1296344 RepID=A0A2T1C9Q3_9CYAN|nr:transaldolase family protein [Merismopedia glauca]PSB04873.1 transaldolase [Merismopedia glauca CCAP 1448/3]
MTLFLDSALIEEAQSTSQLGWVKGITTNPTLLAKSPLSVALTLEKLALFNYTEILYQLTSTDFDRALAEAQTAFKLLTSKTVLKIPATAVGFRVAASLQHQIPVAITGIYSPAQALVAKEVGAKYAIAYVNRATRLMGDGLSLVRSMANVLSDSQTEILAASIKSPTEAVATIEAGAQHLTLPLTVLQSLAVNELSEQTFIEFNANGCGLQE